MVSSLRFMKDSEVTIPLSEIFLSNAIALIR
jgi:hypothetical protein